MTFIATFFLVGGCAWPLDYVPPDLAAERSLAQEDQRLVADSPAARITISFQKPIPPFDAIEFAREFGLTPSMTYVWFAGADGVTGTMATTRPLDQLLAEIALVHEVEGGDLLGVGAFIGEMPGTLIASAQLDERVFLVDPSADSLVAGADGHLPAHPLSWRLFAARGWFPDHDE